MCLFRTIWNLSLHMVGLPWHMFSVRFMGNSTYYYGNIKKCKSLRKNKVLSLCSYNLHRTNDTLEEMRTLLLTKAPQNPSLSTAPRRPDLPPPCIGGLNDRLLPPGNLAPREQLVIPTSTPQTSNDGTLSNLMKVTYIIFFPLGFRFRI